MRRIALIGLGAAARNIHLPAYRMLRQRVQVVGGSDPDRGARDAAARMGVATFADAGEMLERSRPDLVAVCTPPALHREHVELSLAAGCDVFCEKPLAESLADADAMVSAARAAGRKVVVNNEFPAMRIHRAAKSMIDTAEFGRLLYMHGWHTNRPTAATEAGWRSSMSRRLGLEFGIHVFDLVRYLFDTSPVRVLAHHPKVGGTVGFEAVQWVSMEFADGRGASFILDRLSRGRERYLDLRLDGERAVVHTSIGGHLSASVGVRTRTRRPYAELRVAGGGRAVLQSGDRARVLAVDGRNLFSNATAAHFAAFLDALDHGTVPPATADYNRESLALVFAAERAAGLGQAVLLTDFDSPKI